jgi:hypothetical protein
MSTYYAVSMDCPHATIPDVLWHVSVCDDEPPAGPRSVFNAENAAHPMVFVPQLDTWTLDTLRMFLHELAAYLPAHDSAMVTIKAKTNRAPGRAKKDALPRAPRMAERVEISISARGWTAWVWTDRNEATDHDGKYLGRSPGEWSAPMQAVLLDLAQKSPFPLASVRPVDCADPIVLDLQYPARRDVVRGVEPPGARSAAPESHKKRLRRLIDDILGGAQ